MNIFVTFKTCPDLDKLREEDIEFTEEMGIDTHFLPNIINCYDESALELALRVRDSLKEETDVVLSAGTAGDEMTELTLKSLRALGYENTVRFSTGKEISFAPEMVADSMVSYLEKHPQDLIFVGKEAPVGNHGVMALLLASRLDYPCIGSVVDILRVTEDDVTVHISDEGAIVEQTVALPCVLAIGNAVISKMRVPTLRDRMKTKESVSEQEELTALSSAVMEKPLKLNRLPAKRACIVIEKTGQDAVEDVMQQSLKKVLERI